MPDAGRNLVLNVEDWPPTKNEAKSLLAADHVNAPRVRALLASARDAARAAEWTTTTSDIALELVVRGPGRPPSDATNMLGGIGDVLQDKTLGNRGEVSHLGDLALVALYRDDRQIREVFYREEASAQPGYSVSLRILGSAKNGGQSHGDTVSKDVAPRADTATERGRRVIDQLIGKGRDLGFLVETEYPVTGGRLDVVWLLPSLAELPGAPGAVPIVAFEVESSWRTRKHIKGDYLNLFDLGAAIGVIVLLGEDQDVDGTRRFAQTMVDRPGPTVLVWSEEDVQALVAGRIPRQQPAAPDAYLETEPVRASVDQQRHTGKFRGLWAWLRMQPGQEIPITFGEIEEVLGMPLPPSCRKHPPHWHSYEGSAIARAIHDAGWMATRVQIREERLVLVRRNHVAK